MRDEQAIRDLIASWMRATAAGDVFQIRPLMAEGVVFLLPGQWAYCWNHITLTMTPRNGGSATPRAGYTLTVFHKMNDRWVLYRDANMLTAADP